MHLSWTAALAGPTRLSAAAAAITRTRAVAAASQRRLAQPFSRTLWTAATSSHPDLATALSQCLPTTSSTSSTPTFSASTEAKDSVTIILASRSYPGSDLLTLPSKVPSHVAHTSVILGAVVDRVPTKSGHGVSTLTLTPSAESTSFAKGSATVEAGGSKRLIGCQPFYLSGAESRRKRLKEKSVGKWARSQDIQERSLDTSDAWLAFKSISVGQNQVQVPQAILPVASTPSTTSATAQDILMISDLEVHQFLEALDQANPTASKTGLLASSTPFITGQPVTMFYDGQVVRDGVLGVSLLFQQNSSSSSPSSTTVDYPTLAPLGQAMQITRCRGNIILELDESNATRLLLDRLQATTLTKDKEYFLATGELIKAADQDQDKNIEMSKATVYKITGGDPSKGNMAVDTVHDLQDGQWVQFNHHDKALSQEYLSSLQSSAGHGKKETLMVEAACHLIP
ncbi:hypothetical protein B0O80DRAFT_447526 [Mortierella sp. GBAus27b]|nr:hypothetical protein B0O80DRAFT_447526 [Mortierella sp. GBAus27b]